MGAVWGGDLDEISRNIKELKRSIDKSRKIEELKLLIDLGFINNNDINDLFKEQALEEIKDMISCLENHI